MEIERKLLTHTIAGTVFIVDVQRELLLEQGMPDNTIAFADMYYQRAGYYFDYNAALKNIPVSILDGYQSIHIPNMTTLDPEGMALKYGISEAIIRSKADIDVVIDQKLLALREGGQLPILEIAGHPFYVDLSMDALRPKDDFTTTGIRFGDIEDYYDEQSRHYSIPYNPKTHRFEEPDYDTIIAIPRDLIVISIPLPQQLDPVAYARINGFNKDAILMQNRLEMHRKANQIPWEQTPLKQIIARNLKLELENKLTEQKPSRKRGRGI